MALGIPGKHVRVALAEDDLEMRHITARALRQAGCTVVELGSGAELAQLLFTAALEHPADRLVHVVLSDIRMPGCSGLDMLETLRCFDATMPVVFMTAFGDDPTRARAARLGARVVDKPFDLDVLFAAIREALAAKPAPGRPPAGRAPRAQEKP